MGVIEVKVVNKQGKAQLYGISKDKITYFRSYVESSPEEGKNSKLKTVVYLMGSTKSLMADIPYQEFKNKYEAC